MQEQLAERGAARDAELAAQSDRAGPVFARRKGVEARDQPESSKPGVFQPGGGAPPPSRYCQDAPAPTSCEGAGVGEELGVEARRVRRSAAMPQLDGDEIRSGDERARIDQRVGHGGALVRAARVRGVNDLDTVQVRHDFVVDRKRQLEPAERRRVDDVEAAAQEARRQRSPVGLREGDPVVDLRGRGVR